MIKKPMVLFHAHCPDGFCAAWVARKALGEIEAIPAHYGDDPPAVMYRDVYVLDFSYPREVLRMMSLEASSVLVLDHHVTAEANLADLDFCRFEEAESGGRMAWRHFFPGSESPWLVDYTEDRDLWRHHLPFSRAINANLRSFPLDFELWDDLDRRNPLDPADRFVAEGQAILRREQQIVADHVRHAREIVLEGYSGLAVNATTLFSEIAGELAEGRPFGACYFDRADGKRQWSLRSREDGVDVSEIARRRGGGGHRHAAGFEEALGS